MTRSRMVWSWLAFLVALDLIVPWYLLTNDGRFVAAFLFWVVWTAVAIASMFFVMRGWKE
ncbi:MAG: hypothetical protein JW846_04100 [Dehalococcoidia bacterium]|nr:hypothetical protein [Dehalococcoidia bacterium]